MSFHAGAQLLNVRRLDDRASCGNCRIDVHDCRQSGDRRACVVKEEAHLGQVDRFDESAWRDGIGIRCRRPPGRRPNGVDRDSQLDEMACLDHRHTADDRIVIKDDRCRDVEVARRAQMDRAQAANRSLARQMELKSAQQK